MATFSHLNFFNYKIGFSPTYVIYGWQAAAILVTNHCAFSYTQLRRVRQMAAKQCPQVLRSGNAAGIETSFIIFPTFE